MSRRSVKSLVGVVAASTWLVACQNGRSDPPSMLAHDSAGVRMVDVAWQVAVREVDTLWLGEPLLRLGSVDGDAEREFTQIRAIVPLGDLGLAIADAASLDVRVFDWDGRLVSRFGGEGDGPGEFRSITGAFEYRADSIAVHDRRANRVMIFPALGGEPRSFVPPTADVSPNRPNVVGALADGSFVARQDHDIVGMGLNRPSAATSLLDRSGALVTTFDPVPGNEIFLHPALGFTMQMARPFAVQAFASAGQDEVVLGDGGEGVVRRWSAAGTPLSVWRSSEARPVLATADRAAHQDSLLAAGDLPPGMEAAWAEAIGALPYPDSIAVFSGLTTDGQGGVWLLRERPAEDTAVWAVLDSTGRLSHFVAIPPNVSIRRATASHVFAVETDDFDVQHVVIYGR